MVKKEGKGAGWPYIKWFSELSNKDVAIAGGKGASLAEMYNHKFPIPPGFVVSADAYSYFMDKSGLNKKIQDFFEGFDFENTPQLEEVSKKIKQMIIDIEMPRELEGAIWEAYDSLDAEKKEYGDAKGTALDILKRSYEPSFVAVRSSATTEDLADASFAGQQETFLNVKGKANLVEKVKECIASLFTARAIYYRNKKGFGQGKAKLAVVVQKMINADKSGVIFSRDPVGNSENILIEAVWGLGEGIVSGKIKPDSYTIDRNLEELKILDSRISEKKIAFTRDSAGENQVVKLTKERANRQVLTNYEIKKLAQYALKLEEHYKKPQDIEFAISDNDIYIVQSRPVTTLGHTKKKASEIKGDAILSGLGASPGVGVGVVKIVYTLADLGKIEKGDVLVTEMTNPDMVVTMQRASAIVTDEGGVTCFSGDTKVLTNRGFMSIKDATELVNSGEEIILLAYDSKNMKTAWKKIISAAGRKRRGMRISVSQTGRVEDNYLDLTPDHKIITFEGRELIKEQISSILSKEKHLCLIDSLPNSIKMSNTKLAYLIGALMSDGHIALQKYEPTGNLRRGRITFTQKETPQKEEFINTVREYFEECFGDKFKDGRLKYAHGNLRGRIIQGVASDYICNNLEVAKAITKISQNLDKFILGLDQQSCLNFLAGLIDGDGCLYQNRLHIYADKENVVQGIILACLNLGIFPQITKNRTIHHVQILERLEDILRYTRRVKGEIYDKLNGNKLFSARQLFGDIINDVNYKGRIKPYIENNLLIDSRKIEEFILPMAKVEDKRRLFKIVNSNLRMQRVKKICDIGEVDVYNLEIEAGNEIDHNFVVFTKKYTPLLVSNSHAAIVSREMGIPAVVGTENATKKLKDEQIVTVDGNTGKVFVGKGEAQAAEIRPIVQTKTKIKVIVDLPDFAERAALSGARAVGLTRIEGIIAESGKHPIAYVKQKKTEDYIDLLYNGLRKIAEPFDEVWVRTSDIRSDEFKHLEGSPKEAEGNPMLGNHGVRFSLKNPEIMKAEIWAIKKVAADFPGKKIGIMMPQVINVSELKETKKIAAEIGIPENVKIGIMVETPAAVQIINDLCAEGISFISFGTNDLTQYILAIDRNNTEVQYLYDEMNPAVLTAIGYVIRRCKKFGVETSICGQAGSRPEMAKFLVEQGIDSISVNADAAEEISKLIAKLENGENADLNSGNSVQNAAIPSALIGEKVEGKTVSFASTEEPKKQTRKIEEIFQPKKEIKLNMDKEGMNVDIQDVILKELEGQEKEQEKAAEVKEAPVEAVAEKIAEKLDEIKDNPEEKKDEEYISIGDSTKEVGIPSLNDAIPVTSELFEEVKKVEEFDLEKELAKEVEKEQ